MHIKQPNCSYDVRTDRTLADRIAHLEPTTKQGNRSQLISKRSTLVQLSRNSGAPESPHPAGWNFDDRYAELSLL
jgi:hypothetical protein